MLIKNVKKEYNRSRQLKGNHKTNNTSCITFCTACMAVRSTTAGFVLGMASIIVMPPANAAAVHDA